MTTSLAVRCCQGQRVKTTNPTDRSHLIIPNRRAALLATTLSLASTIATPRLSRADTDTFTEDTSFTSTSSTATQPDLTITDKVFLEIGLCPEAVRANRTLGDKSILCSDPEILGRIVIGLYGKHVPSTVEIFKACILAGSYNGTIFSKVLPGQYILAGTQGSKRSGYTQPPENLPSNPDTLSSAAFSLKHQRPGTVSLNLSNNEDEDFIRFGKNYRNTSFLITTGPGPVPFLDGENIPFGQVIEGLDVVNAITKVPVFGANSDLGRAFNQLGQLIGDERASKTQAKWGRPLKAVLIFNSGVL